MGNYSDHDRKDSWRTKYGDGKHSNSSSKGDDKYGGSSSSEHGSSSDSLVATVV